MGIIHARRLLSRQIHNREPDDEVFMSCQFANVLERELKAVGLSPLAVGSCANEAVASLAPSRRAVTGSAVPASFTITDKTAFSPKAVNLSFSLRHYARDADRPGRSDPSVVTGWNEAGYLRDTGQGLGGEMRFATASGTLVSVHAETGGEGRTDVRVRAVKDGVEHSFSLDDFSECRRDGTVPSAPLAAHAALPAGEASRNVEPEDEARQTTTYTARSAGRQLAVGRPNRARDLVC